VHIVKNKCETRFRDKSVKVWTFNNNNDNNNNSLVINYSVLLEDRIWSVAVNESKAQFIIGSAGCRSNKPLLLYDIECGKLISQLGDNYRRGAGVLHVLCESETQVLSCGYDTCIRLWDIRDKPNCVLKCEDPHDSAIYCIDSDHFVTILSGTARYGLTRLWDKRYPSKYVQMYYVGKDNSPVYSLSFDACHAYIALDNSINLLSFSK